MLDVRKYRKPRFLKAADFAAGPKEFTIVDCSEGQYGLDILIESGDTVTANPTSVSRLSEAWDFDAHQWRGYRFKAELVENPVEENGKPMVLLSAISKTGDERKQIAVPIARPKPQDFGMEAGDPGNDGSDVF
jgi:hypothetical protein